MPGRLKDEPELIAYARLAFELGQRRGTEHGLCGALRWIGGRAYKRGEVLIAHRTHRLLYLRAKLCNAARIKTATLACGSSRARCSTSSQAASASLADQPRPCNPWVTCPRQAAGGPTADTGSSVRATALILSFNSMTMRCAPLRPIPGTLHSWTRFSVAIVILKTKELR